MLSRQDILNYDDAEHRVVKGVWGGDVRIRSMSCAEMFAFSALLNEAKATGDYTKVHCSALSWCCVDDQDKPIFEAADIEKLGRKSHRNISKVFGEIVAMNTVSDEAIDAKKKR